MMRILLLTLLLFYPLGASAEEEPAADTAKTNIEDLNSYWTPERMRNAKPLPMGVIPSPVNAKPLIPHDNNLKLSRLIKEMGEKDALKLGFITRISQETLIVTRMGEDYLSQVLDQNITSPAEVFAAGFKSANSP